MFVNDNIKGALFMALAMLGFSVNDAIVKAVTGDVNVGQIIFIRGLFATFFIFWIARYFGALRPLKTVFSGALLLRAMGEVGAAVAYIYALGKIPIANTSAILQALPLAVTLGAALFLKEPVGWRRWLAIIAGFTGVLIVVRPGPEGFSFAALVCVFSMLTAAIRDLSTKRINRDVPAIFVTLVSAVIVSIAGALLIQPMGGWQPMNMSVLTHLFLSSIGLIAGYQGIVLAMRTGEISFIAPFRYTSLLWSITFGILFFGEVPDHWTLVGVVIIILSGLYAFYRENQRRKRLAMTIPAEGV